MSNIKLFESKKNRSAWNEAEQKWYFSVADVVAALTDSADLKQYIKRMRQRDPELNSYWGTICTLVVMPAADGKRRQVQSNLSRFAGLVFGTSCSAARKSASLKSFARLAKKCMVS